MPTSFLVLSRTWGNPEPRTEDVCVLWCSSTSARNPKRGIQHSKVAARSLGWSDSDAEMGVAGPAADSG